ncbi:poly [ADP-ribose] polymerase [Belonocnema kinseyi]|uniref:poly [ADP-ribose] polymerase n=1 Tax=Belonocnema kinseyi TaxID=2817044 RepID=UPI00143D6B0A|nr:poly [ADP-ribose] polymerase [Belonocnema kinseyi]
MGDLPYLVEYSKSGRASCKACKTPIAKDSLRLAAIVQSPFHDGKMPKWYHSHCFFTKNRPKTIGDIAHFESIRWEDQNFVKQHIENNAAGGGDVVDSGKGKGKGRKRASSAAVPATLDFKVEYAKSNRSKCRGCEETIVKGEVRISKLDLESEEAKRFDGLDLWHHVPCFVKLRNDLEFFAGGDTLPGIKSLTPEDQQMIKTNLPKIQRPDIPPVKKIKEEPEDAAEEAKMQEQNKKMFKIRDKLGSLTKTVLLELLNANKQFLPEGTSAIQDVLADAMTFGALEPCKKCGGQFKFKSGVGYTCTGDISEWTKCEEVQHDPKRKKFVVPKNLKEKSDFLGTYKAKVARRIFRITAPSTSSAVKKEEKAEGPKVQSGPRPLKNMIFLIAGRTKTDKEVLKRNILLLGGKVVTKLDENVTAVISIPKEVEKMSSKIEDAKDLDIHIISEDFVEEAKPLTDSAAAVTLLEQKSICTWGGDPTIRISKVAAKSNASRGKSVFEKKSSSGKVKLRVKGGGAVDPESKLEDEAHVYQRGKEKFNFNLGLTDIQSGKNSYYKMQILKHDKKERYWLHRNWGRIGTTIGGVKTDKMALEDCIAEFERHYEEKTGNPWSKRDNFIKYPGKMYPLDVEYGDEADDDKIFESEVPSKLKKPVQDLIKLIFDVSAMKQVMKEFEIDIDKMPLGKLSRKQIEKAFAVLSEMLQLVNQPNPERIKLVDASNRFYTLVPHDFGVSEPTIISTPEEIKAKTEMLESLLDMEIAYSLLNVKTDSTANPIDAHYEQLNAEIDVMDKTSEEFKVLEQYVKNTHAATHQQYELEIEEVYMVKRQGEERRYKPFKKLGNRKLLWHGSRTTNYAGILSQGLRIAPPEAPVTGYMFGKGIYFADMVSKSANYCCTNSQNPTGLLLLCEVALGEMYERFQSEYVEKLPHGKHSTFGRGQTQPDPSVVYKTKDDVEIPYGPGVPAKLPQKSALLYNEYIVYDIAQVKTQYLVKMNFKFKY